MKKRAFQFKIVAFISALLVVVLSAFPLYNQHNAARLLTLIFGAFGCGAMLTDLFHNVRKQKQKV
jgi:uncharacterized membrane protein